MTAIEWRSRPPSPTVGFGSGRREVDRAHPVSARVLRRASSTSSPSGSSRCFCSTPTARWESSRERLGSCWGSVRWGPCWLRRSPAGSPAGSASGRRWWPAFCVLCTASAGAAGRLRRAPTAILTLLLLAEFGSGFGVMLLDITVGAIFLAMVPDPLLARFSGAYITANYGVRAFGSVAAGLHGHGGGGAADAVDRRRSARYCQCCFCCRAGSCGCAICRSPHRPSWARSRFRTILDSEPSTPSESHSYS